MVVFPLKFWRFPTLFLAVFVCAILSISCGSYATTTSEPDGFERFSVSEAEFDLGDEEKFEFEIIGIPYPIDERFLVHYIKKDKATGKELGNFFRISVDGARSFSEEYNAGEMVPGVKSKSRRIVFHFFEGGLAAVINEELSEREKNRQNKFYTRTDRTYKNWNKPVRVNEGKSNVYGAFTLVHHGDDEVYCSWMQGKAGATQLFFSRSDDGGKSWSRNIQIEKDFRKGSQGQAILLISDTGRLHAIWQDFRDQKTLYDIRHSYSDDKGETWALSKKINDDDDHVWQHWMSAAISGEELFVVFADFREKGVENDNDWNIYSARSVDNGETWGENQRVNKIKAGRQDAPRLIQDPDGTLYCLWMTTENTLFNQFVFSYSRDFGRTWAPKIEISGREEMVYATHGISRVGEGSLVTWWTDMTYGRPKTKKILILEKTDEMLFAESRKRESMGSPKLIEYSLGNKLFEDDFSSETSEKNWIAKKGAWSVVGGAFRGSRPYGKALPVEDRAFVAYAGFDEPESYVLKGKFKLDETRHGNADIYFRSNDLRHYVIKNLFRHGTWLSLKDDALEKGLHQSGGRVLAQVPFPYRQGRWYEFVLVVTPDQVDYYVDSRLRLSFKSDLVLKNGKFGIGGWIHPPTYFDDIAIYELRDEASK